MSKIILANPFREKQEKERAEARKMDVINLARNLVIHANGKLHAEEAFDYAETFKAEEELRYPAEAL